MNIKDTLFALSNADSVGHIKEASNLAFDILNEYCTAQKTDNLTVYGIMSGESDYTIMLDAHIDQIAMIVTSVDDKGFLTVSNAGGIDVRMLPSRRVTVHGKEKVSAVFSSTPPHLSKGEEQYSDITDLKLDTALGKKAKDIISVGDYVTFLVETYELLGDRVCGRSFDNRASVACLLEVAKRLSGKKLPVSVAFVFSDSEEIGMRGIRPATFKINPQESVVVDVSFGDGIGISPEESGKLGEGGMIGISPSLDRNLSRKLTRISKEKNIPYQLEVMGRSTGTNADMVGVSREGVKTCTLSIPIRNMHTDVEILDLKDLNAVCDLLCEYILSGGALGA